VRAKRGVCFAPKPAAPWFQDLSARPSTFDSTTSRAARASLPGAVLGRAFVLMSVGSIAGLVLGLLATKVLSHIVYQASPNDPLVLGGVVVTMLALGLAASWIPAQRALAVNPIILLREE